MDRFKKLTSGEISWSTSIREYVKEGEKAEECIYCGGKEDLTLDHILPRSRGRPDLPDNAVLFCRSCNSSKGDRRVYEWYQE
jgi:5-methylcytosine-specific restriction endonuclease McrA